MRKLYKITIETDDDNFYRLKPDSDSIDSQLNKDDLIIFKYLKTPYDYSEIQDIQLQVFQVANPIAKGVTTVLYSEFTLSPYNFNVDEYPEIKTLIEQYQLEPIELWS